MFLMSFLFVAVATYIVGLIGSSNSPVSGMTICAVLFTGAFLGVLGMSGAPAIVATLGVAGVVCCAACSAGDISQDLKTGYIIGATPRRQQWMEVIGAVIPALAMAPILIVLHRAYGIGTGQPGALNAPQATLFANLVKGLFGAGALPWKIILVGAALGVGIIIADGILRARRAPFHLPVMAVAVGMYLPLPMTMAMLFGGLVSRFAKNRSESGPGVLFASGLVAGEAVMGVVIGILIYIHKEITPLVELPIRLIRVPLAGSDALSVLFLLGVGALLYAVGRRERKPASVDPA
jgi:putative OPT family oligopeptide transporter